MSEYTDIYDTDGGLLAIVSNFERWPNGLTFVGQKSDALQVGTFRYPAGKVMRDHAHVRRPRTIERTQEVVVLFKGSCTARVYSKDLKTVIATWRMTPGEVLISYSGGVGYTILENDTILMEVKAGDYLVNSDDEDRVLISTNS
jgi:hypothetical protein